MPPALSSRRSTRTIWNIQDTLRRFLGLKEKTVGSARTGRGRYDLPLAGGTGTGFLLLLISLMTFLAFLALSGSFALGRIGAQWRSGLEGQATVEIPATDASGKILPESVRKDTAQRVLDFLKGAPAVGEARLLSPQEISDLVGPWLGDLDTPEGEEILPGIALPTVISLTLTPTEDSESVTALNRKLQSISDRARLDTHQDWLGDMLRFSDALQTAALVIALVTGITAGLAVAGAVRSRMAEHKADIEILHLMGATDSYIVRQFERHAISLAFRGGCMGLVAGWAILILIGLVAGQADNALVPDVSFTPTQIGLLLALPVLASALACLAARVSVRRALAHMP